MKNITDYDLVRAVSDLADVYEHNGRKSDEDCIRLTIPQARRLAKLADAGLSKTPLN